MARNEAARFTIQYDRLYVDNEIYIYNEVEEKVEKIKMTVPKGTLRGGAKIFEATSTIHGILSFVSK